MATNELETGTLENWLWEAACKIRGEIDAPKYKDYNTATGIPEAAVGRV